MTGEHLSKSVKKDTSSAVCPAPTKPTCTARLPQSCWGCVRSQRSLTRSPTPLMGGRSSSPILQREPHTERRSSLSSPRVTVLYVLLLSLSRFLSTTKERVLFSPSALAEDIFSARTIRELCCLGWLSCKLHASVHFLPGTDATGHLPTDPLGHGTAAGCPNLVCGHQMPASNALGHPL